MFNNRILRIGSYGDPAAAPLNIWEKVIKASKSFVGYSHNWMHCNQRWNKYLMASIETIKQQELANKKGWRTFRIMVDNSKVSNNEIHCPASIEMGKKTTCEKCLSCGGNHSKLKKNVAIVAHGRVAKKFSRIMRLRMNKKKYTHLVK